MKIVTRISDGAVVMVANCPNPPFDTSAYTITDAPGWDWSMANLTGVDRTAKSWVYCQTRWNGTTLVKRDPFLPAPSA